MTDSPSRPGYVGDKVWPTSMLVCLAVWADYAGAADAQSSAGRRVWDIFASCALALGLARGVAADEIKATTKTLFGAGLGLFSPSLSHSCTDIWRSRGYDGATHTTAAAIAMTRGIPYPENERTLDLAAAAMAVHDAIDCEADVIDCSECNLILITAYKGISTRCIIDTAYATLALCWTAADIYGQFPLGALQEQSSGSHWGGPAYAAEARISASSNIWTEHFSAEQFSDIFKANVLPTTSKRFVFCAKSLFMA